MNGLDELMGKIHNEEVAFNAFVEGMQAGFDLLKDERKYTEEEFAEYVRDEFEERVK